MFRSNLYFNISLSLQHFIDEESENVKKKCIKKIQRP